MITRIFFDLDECLFHTILGGKAPQDCFTHFDDGNPDMVMHTIFNPLGYPALEHARSLVGNENVFVLTSSLRWYAERLCAAGKFGFRNDQIFTREDLHEHRYSGAYGASYDMPHAKLADKNNVLIDNLPPRYNENKMSFIGIRDVSRYIQVRDYYGVNFPDDSFAENIIETLNTLQHS